MAQAKKSSVKTKKTKTKKSSRTLKPVSFNKYIFGVFIILFASVGIAFLLRSFAAEGPSPVVAAYVNEKASSVTKDDSTGKYVYESSPATYALAEDGSVSCDDGNSTGVVTTGKVGKGIVKQIQKELQDSKIADLPKEITANGQPQTYVNNFEGYILSDNGKFTAHAVFPGGAKPDKLARMQEKIVKACEKADVKQDRMQGSNIGIPSLTKADKITTLVASALFPKASASVPPPPPPPTPVTYRDTAGEARHVELINQYRVANGLPALKRMACIDTVAANWSNYMATNQILSHNPNYFQQMQSYCYATLTFGAENVAMGSIQYQTPESIFQGFLNSADHKRNIMTPKARLVGVGVYHNNYTNANSVTYNFANW